MKKRTIAFLMCAGVGERMMPLTRSTPKPALPFFDAPIVSYSLKTLIEAGITDIGVVVGHLGKEMEECVRKEVTDYCVKFKKKVNTKFVCDYPPSGSGGSLQKLFRAFGSDEDADYLIINGDTVVDIDLQDFLEQHERLGTKITMLVVEDEERESLRIDSDTHKVVGIRSYGEKVEDSSLNLKTGDFIWGEIISGELLAELPEGESDLIDVLHSRYIGDGVVGAVLHNDFYATFDTPKDLHEMMIDIKNGYVEWKDSPISNFKSLEKRLDDVDVDLEELTLVLRDQQIQRGRIIGKAKGLVVIYGCEVGRDTELENAILYHMGTLIGSWRNCIGVNGELVVFDDEPEY